MQKKVCRNRSVERKTEKDKIRDDCFKKESRILCKKMEIKDK